MSDEERAAMLIQNGVNSTIELALECAKRTDEINRRLIIAIIVMTIVFGATTCITRYIDLQAVYTPELEQSVTDGSIIQTTK